MDDWRYIGVSLSNAAYFCINGSLGWSDFFYNELYRLGIQILKDLLAKFLEMLLQKKIAQKGSIINNLRAG